jgi:lysozyme family protein
MARLTPAFFQKILRIEGGYQNMPDDNGNYTPCGTLAGTKYGVSAVAYSTWVGRCATEQEMRNLTEQTAFNFYAWYFDLYNNFQIENQQLFELSANNTMGSPTAAAKVEQRVLNRLGAYNLTVDGARGPRTIAALNTEARRDMPRLYDAIRSEWIEYLRSLDSRFFSGWMVRMESFPPLGSSGSLQAGGIWIGVVLILVFLAKKRSA